MSQPKLDPSQITIGTVGGIAGLDASGYLQTTQVPPALVGGLAYKGTWNATTNTPTLTSGVGTTGWEYVVSVAGTTTIDGTSAWSIGDTIIFSGTAWQRIPGPSVTSVTGTTNQIVASPTVGNVVLSLANPIDVNTTGTASLATNVAGGVAGNMIWQVSPGVSGFVASGVANQILQSNGASSPSWTSTPTLASIAFSDSSVLLTAVDHLVNTVAVTTGSHIIIATEDYVGVNFAGAVALTLNTVNNKRVTIKDESGAAATNVITITPSTGLIEGQASVTISVNWMALTLVCRVGSWFIV